MTKVSPSFGKMELEWKSETTTSKFPFPVNILPTHLLSLVTWGPKKLRAAAGLSAQEVISHLHKSSLYFLHFCLVCEFCLCPDKNPSVGTDPLITVPQSYSRNFSLDIKFLQIYMYFFLTQKFHCHWCVLLIHHLEKRQGKKSLFWGRLRGGLVWFRVWVPLWRWGRPGRTGGGWMHHRRVHRCIQGAPDCPADTSKHTAVFSKASES